MSFSLSTLLDPVRLEEFFDRFWEKDVVHIQRNNADYFSLLGGKLSIEEIIFLSCPQWGEVSLARAGTSASECTYISAPPRLNSIKRAFVDRYTIVVNDLQRKDIAVAE